MSLIVVMNVYCSVVAWLILAGGWPTTYAGDLATSVFMRNPFIGYLVLRAPKIKKLLLLQSFLKGPPWLGPRRKISRNGAGKWNKENEAKLILYEPRVPQRLTSLCAKHHHQISKFALTTGWRAYQNYLISFTYERLSTSFVPLVLLSGGVSATLKIYTC